MRCNIHAYAEKKIGGKWWQQVNVNFEGFYTRSYGAFGFLANVRNYSAIPVIAYPRGFPDDASVTIRKEYADWGGADHSASWLTLAELQAFDYDAPMEDRRVTRQLAPGLFSGACTADPGGGRQTTFREFLGPQFFDDIKRMADAGAERVVFWFDN